MYYNIFCPGFEDPFRILSVVYHVPPHGNVARIDACKPARVARKLCAMVYFYSPKIVNNISGNDPTDPDLLWALF